MGQLNSTNVRVVFPPPLENPDVLDFPDEVVVPGQVGKKTWGMDLHTERYSVEKLIGQGQHSSVYLVERMDDRIFNGDKIPGRVYDFAMKVRELTNANAIGVFQREGQVMSGLEHEHVVKVSLFRP